MVVITPAFGDSDTSTDANQKNVRNVAGHELFEMRFRQFTEAVDRGMELRIEAKEFFKKLNRKLSADEHLTSADQETIRRHLRVYRENRDTLVAITSPYAYYFAKEDTVEFSASSATERIVRRSENGGRESVLVRINPGDDLGRLMILEIKMSLAAQLMVLDNYVVALVRYIKTGADRRQFDISEIDPEGKRFLVELREEMVDSEKYSRTLRAIHLARTVQEYEATISMRGRKKDKDMAYLDTLITGSYAFHRIPELGLLDRVEIESAFLGNTFFDFLDELTGQATNEVSELFGNTIGLYEERKGKLYSMPDSERGEIAVELELLDILMEKTPFRLTDLVIPGHWGHVAIWTGGKKDIPELKRLGVWRELPLIERNARKEFGYTGPSFQEMVRNDRGVLEALRHGVEVNTFGSFLNIDDLAVLRSKGLTDEQKRSYLLSAFAQIGKPYDFNFDVESNREIVCSELVFVVYRDFDWPVEKTLGRYTVSPDHIAMLARSADDPFTPVLLYHDGKRLPRHLNYSNLNRLMNEQYYQVEYH